MKSFQAGIDQLSCPYFRKAFTAIVLTTAMFLTCREAYGWIAAGGRGVAVGRGYGYGCGAVGVRGGYYGGAARLPYCYYGAITGADRTVCYGTGHFCYRGVA